MSTRFVLRILDAEDQLMAWTEVLASPRPGGQFVADALPEFYVTKGGRPHSLVVQWPDLDLAKKHLLHMDAFILAEGSSVAWSTFGVVWIVEGDADAPLPPVEQRAAVSVMVPTRIMGMRSA